MDKEFFSKDISNLKSDKEYYTSFKSSGDIKKLIVILNNTRDDGEPYPVVVSVQISESEFKNYIVKFNEDSKLIVDFTNELKAIDHKKNVTGIEISEDVFKFKKKPYIIHLVSSFPFQGEYFINHDDPEPLIVKEPEIQDVALRNSIDDDLDECCLSTNGQKVCIRSVFEYNGAVDIAWAKVVRTECTGDPDDWARCKINLTVYYPTQSELIHVPTGTGPNCSFQMVEIFHTYTLKCISPTTSVSTKGYSAPQIEHRWDNMVYAINPGGGYGLCTQTAGPLQGQRWKIYYND